MSADDPVIQVRGLVNRFGKQAVYFASAHDARDRGGMHIAFNHIPDPETDK